MTSLIEDLGRSAREASTLLAGLPDRLISDGLLYAAANIRKFQSLILTANLSDLNKASATGISASLLDRLTLNPARLDAIAQGVETIAALPGPVGKILSKTTRPNGLKISRITVPLGVLGIIYESRPNVTADAIALCLKSRNCVILRGGSESLESNKAIYRIFNNALLEFNIPAGVLGFVDNPDRSHVGEMLAARNTIDVIIPRGGKSLTERVLREAKMPVFAHLDGICHVYVDRSADTEMARKIILNAKMRRTGICGAAETLLLDKSLPDASVKLILFDLMQAGCVIIGDKRAQTFDKSIEAADERDWSTEYLDAKISVKFVEDKIEAVRHINFYGSHHTESIVAEDLKAVDYFMQNVNSAIVMHNTSTQFADGGEFGMGAEIGISTGKFHARGPVGLEQLTTYKYIVEGNGQIRD